MKVKDYKVLEENFRNAFGYDCMAYELIGTANGLPFVEFKKVESIDELTDEELEYVKSEIDFDLLKYVENPKDNPIAKKECEIEKDKVVLTCLFHYPEYSNRELVTILGKRSFRKASKKELQEKCIEEFKKECEEKAKKIYENYSRLKDLLDLISEVRYSLNKIKAMGYSEEDFLKALNLYLGLKEAKNKIKYLKENGFKGVENFGVYEVTPDGFGHQLVKYSQIDFFKKEVTICVGSSDD